MTDSKIPADQPEKITTVEKTKDPKRVEAGKKLAAISKAAKEKKMREKIEMEKSINTADSNDSFKLATIIVVVVVSLIIITFYSNKKPTDEKITTGIIKDTNMRETELENL